MIKVSKRFADRAKANLKRYQKILESARTRDVNESDTVVIISDFLGEILGYDKYQDVTTEFAIRSTFCDLAVKRDGRLAFLIEVKSIGTELRENHLRQAVDYGASQGVEWVILTNGVCWNAYRIRFEQPLTHDLVFKLDLLDPATKPAVLLERLFLLSKEAGGQTEMDRYHKHQEATSRYVVAQVLLTDEVLAVVRRQMRQAFPGANVDPAELREVLVNEVLKREVLEGEKATAAQRALKKLARKKATVIKAPAGGALAAIGAASAAEPVANAEDA